MPSLAQRIRAFLNPIPQATKSYSTGSLFGLLGYTGQNYDLRADEYGAAQAVTVVTEVQRAVKFWQQWLSGLVWHIYDGKTDEILVSSTDRKVNNGAGAFWFTAMKRFPENWKHDFFESVAFSDWVYAETYIGKLRNRVQVADVMWLNPLAIEPDIQRGQILGYRYTGDEGYLILDTNEVAYRIASRNPFDDWRGVSPVLAAIDKINITENAHRTLNSYYRNHMQLGGVVSGKPSDNSFSLDGGTIEEIKEDMRRNHKGAHNAFGWFFSNAPVDVQQFNPVDIEKNYAIVEPLRKQIAQAMGVPPVLSGDPTEVNYDNADKVMKNWWQTDGIPYARKVEGFVNRQLLPEIEVGNDVYFGFDYAKFEIEDPDTVAADFSSQIIPINVAQQKRGYEVDDSLADIYIVNGRPMHRDIIVQVAMAVPPEYQASKPAQMEIVNQQPPLNNPELVIADSDSELETEKAAFLTLDDPLSNELQLWQKVAMRRFKSDKLDDALSFESDVIPVALSSAIRGALSTVTSRDEIYTVFDDANRWLTHA
jgi:hypothetical protein